MDLPQILNDLSVEISECRLCDAQKILLKHGPPMNRGQGTSVLVIGQQPGKTELKTGVAFSGAAGTRLMDWLQRAGLGKTRDEILQYAYLTSLCKCSISLGSQFDQAAKNCFPFLKRQIDLICPKICLTLGAVPLRVLFDYNGQLDELIGTVGPELRETLHQGLIQAGQWKIYCTVPADNFSAIMYLLKSGYSVEGHLERHYHIDHGELVFGMVLRDSNGKTGETFNRSARRIRGIRRLTSTSSAVIEFTHKVFTRDYAPVDPDWTHRQLSIAAKFKKGTRAFKKRLAYVANVGKAILAMVLCVFKRGGSVKLVLLSETEHSQSLSDLISFAEQSVLKLLPKRTRKFYAHVPLLDHKIVEAFVEADYFPEGVLQKPYNDYYDYIVLAKSAHPKAFFGDQNNGHG